jgi:DNA-binding transcriptional ArsR family regulator
MPGMPHASANSEASPADIRGAATISSGMADAHPSIAEIAALIGNPARTNILTALLDGRALTAGELARAAGVSAQTTSGHLARMTEARLLILTRQGRHAYYRLASPRVAQMLEAITAVAADGVPAARWRGGEALRNARTCYDHLAGRLGVALADALAASGHVLLDQDGGMVTAAGEEFLAGFGLHLDRLAQGRRVFCRPCLDWSERRPHLAGALGAALASRCFELGWVARLRDTRALEISRMGERGFAETFAIELPAAA